MSVWCSNRTPVEGLPHRQPFAIAHAHSLWKRTEASRSGEPVATPARHGAWLKWVRGRVPLSFTALPKMLNLAVDWDELQRAPGGGPEDFGQPDYHAMATPPGAGKRSPACGAPLRSGRWKR